EFLSGGALDRIALGHTRSDQAETVLFRFLRGSGSAGLSGIRPATGDGIVRPLIDADRSEVLDYLRSPDLNWREASTNTSLPFARNRIRTQVLPHLAREWNPSMGETLAQTAEWALAEESWWECEIERLAGTHLVVRDGSVLVRASALLDLPLAA